MGESAVTIGRRVVVTGLAGSGKSTFSRALATKTGLPLIHLDLAFWKPGWVAPSEREWRETQTRALAVDEWIADGNYHQTLDLRLARADTIVVLDTPWPVCAARAFRRGLRRPAGAVMPEGCPDSTWQRVRDEWGIVGRILWKRRAEPDLERKIIAEHGQHAALHVLASKRAVRAFLDRVGFDDSEANG